MDAVAGPADPLGEEPGVARVATGQDRLETRGTWSRSSTRRSPSPTVELDLDPEVAADPGDGIDDEAGHVGSPSGSAGWSGWSDWSGSATSGSARRRAGRPSFGGAGWRLGAGSGRGCLGAAATSGAGSGRLDRLDGGRGGVLRRRDRRLDRCLGHRGRPRDAAPMARPDRAGGAVGDGDRADAADEGQPDLVGRDRRGERDRRRQPGVGRAHRVPERRASCSRCSRHRP